jgi:hypothetical protein
VRYREVCVVLHSINERYGGGEMMEEITRNLSESTTTLVDGYMATWIALAILAFLLMVVPLIGTNTKAQRMRIS